MLSNQKLQNAINEIKEITGKDVCLYMVKEEHFLSTNSVDDSGAVKQFLEEDDEWCLCAFGMLFKSYIDEELSFVLGLSGADSTMTMIGQMACCQIRNIIVSFAEQFDRNNFMQNLLLGNFLVVDIFSKAKKLHIEAHPRAVFVIDTGKKSNDVVLELVKNLSEMRSKDFVTNVDEHSVVLIKDVSGVSEEEMETHLASIAASLADNLHMEAMIRVRVGYGNVVLDIPSIAESYKEAKMALEVGRVFYAEYDTISYGKLGIGRLIYQLPMSLCDMFIKEVFGDEIPDILDDEEAMSTINKFFENNLNISETARQLYVHRNTLVYRLERIQKAIGLDIGKFDDAMTFKIAVMVIAHMRNQRQ